MIVKPMSLSESQKLVAIAIAPLTIRSPPKRSPTNPSPIQSKDFRKGEMAIMLSVSAFSLLAVAKR